MTSMTSDLWRSVLPGDVVKLQGDNWIADGYAIVTLLDPDIWLRERTNLPTQCWGTSKRLTDNARGTARRLWIAKYSIVEVVDVPPTREALPVFAMLVMGHMLPNNVLDEIMKNRKYELTRTEQGTW
ncbi:hypothetical protein [Pseudolabrys sp.]|uniref:hypothetical protein n=1 Tax=Pseudolabrys sp. TaxID=1960880 RepID=UPI003D0A04EF